MKQLVELARLRFELGRSYTEIAGSLGVARSTVQEAVRRFRSAGLSWPLPPELDEDVLYARLYPVAAVASNTAEPDFAALSKELARKGVTRKLAKLREVYAATHPVKAQRTAAAAQADAAALLAALDAEAESDGGTA